MAVREQRGGFDDHAGDDAIGRRIEPDDFRATFRDRLPGAFAAVNDPESTPRINGHAVNGDQALIRRSV